MKRKIKLYFIDICLRLLNILKFSKNRVFKIGSLKLKIPYNHTLPYFKSRHRLYDEFIGFMAQEIEEYKCIVDVGANVGDTAAFIAAKSNCNLVLVEPSKKYFGYLKQNVASWNLSQEILLFNFALSNKEVDTSRLFHHNGTAVKSLDKGEEVPFTKGDNLEIGDNIGLIKVDTDGYDSEAILSFKSKIKKEKPIIFFENQILNNDNERNYRNLYTFLEDHNYKCIVIFDNCGNLLMKLTDYAQLEQFNNYFLRMAYGELEYTLYYLDVLVGTQDHIPKINNAIENYLKSNF